MVWVSDMAFSLRRRAHDFGVQRFWSLVFSLQAAASEFTVKVRSGAKEIDEKITVNTEEETETFHITNDSDSGDIDVVYDFKKVGASD